VAQAILKKNQAELNMNDLDIANINKQLSNSSPQEIVAWALSLGKKTITTTSFQSQLRCYVESNCRTR
jgi:hypothetical protein